MACRITLPVWPNSLNNISWSKDNLIALACGDQVAVLSPRLLEPGPNGTYWDSTIFRANEFTADEIPLRYPISFRNFSPGEELSLRHVHAVEWSPPGLARFGQCMLAVLSTNHVLSLWECEGRSTVDANWKRKVIVNHALQSHYARRPRNDTLSSLEQEETVQVQQRVRAFAWAPFDWRQAPSDGVSSVASSKNRVLAVSTEANDILILSVRAPYDILQPSSKEFDVKVLYSFSTSERDDQMETNGVADEHSHASVPRAKNRVANHLAWSDLKRGHDDECEYAQLAYAADDRLFYSTLKVNFPAQSSKAQITQHYQSRSVLRSATKACGPLKFAPGTGLFIAFATDRVYCVDTEKAQTEDSQVTSHHLDDRWDEISGLVFTQPSGGKPKVHITSHLSSASAKTTVLQLPLDSEAVSIRPPWQQAINECKASFSEKWGLAGYVAERVWGIASSPLNEYIVTPSTLLPSDCVVYSTQAEQKTVLNITYENSFDQHWMMGDVAQPRLFTNIAGETKLFSLQRLVDRLPRSAKSHSAMQEMVKLFEASSSGCSPVEPAPEASNLDKGFNILYLQQQISLHDDVQNRRAEFLASFILKKSYHVSPAFFKVVVERLVKTVLDLPVDLATIGILSSRLRAQYATIKSKLEPAGSNAHPAETNVPNAAEQCRICQKAVPFESLKWARCENGHQFSRCKLTFFAIQEPGISKHCSICGTQFFNEWHLPEMVDVIEDVDMQAVSGEVNALETGMNVVQGEQMADSGPHINPEASGDRTHLPHGTAKEPALSLARTLFAAFDACIFCGGKFIT